MLAKASKGTAKVTLPSNGFECAFHGEYREILPESGWSMQHASQHDRDMHLQSGMEVGLQDALDLLEELAISLG